MPQNAGATLTPENTMKMMGYMSRFDDHAMLEYLLKLNEFYRHGRDE